MTWIEHLPIFGKREVETPHGLLVFLDAVGGHVLEAGFFFSVAWAKWRHYSCPNNVPLKQWVACSWQAILPCVMVAIIGFVYYLSRHSAKFELSTTEKLFPENRIPKNWIVPRDPAGITMSVIAFFSLYIVLALVADHIRLVSMLMLAIACIDFNTRRLINARVDKYFKDSEYEPQREDPNYTLILERRKVVLDYLLKKPHLWKEAARAGGCALALVIAVSGHRSAAYFVLMTTLIVNEIVTWNWRAERDHVLKPLLGQHDGLAEDSNQVRRQKSFSVIAWIASILYMALAGYVAWREGTFTAGSVSISFANHGGMWGDFMILPIVNGLIVPYLPRITGKRRIVAGGLLACAIMLTVFAHAQWAAMGKALGTTDFVFPQHTGGGWYNDMSVSGYLHLGYMGVELALILGYAWSQCRCREFFGYRAC
jgi:hypothetical protein